MSEFVPVLSVHELPEEGFKAVEVQGRSILIGRIGNELFAWLDRCPHAGAPLRIGKLRGNELKCAWHGWTFDVLTGKSIPDNPAFQLTQIPSKIEDSWVFVVLST